MSDIVSVYSSAVSSCLTNIGILTDSFIHQFHPNEKQNVACIYYCLCFTFYLPEKIPLCPGIDED